ncbi:TolC family protein, partial [Gemmatimonadota bacterium]
LYRRGQDQYDRGDMSESELLQLEVELAASRDRSSAASGRFTREVANFNQTIGLPLEQQIAIRHEIDYSPVAINDAELLEKALSQRSDLRRDEMSREEEEMSLREERAEGSLTGDISLTLGLEGREKNMDAFYHAMLNPDQARQVAVNFSLPLWDWGRNRASVNGILTELEKMDREREETVKTIRREVGSVIARIRESESRLEGLAASVESARRSYGLSLAQFDLGELSVQDLLLTQNRFSDARQNYLGAYINYRSALTDLVSVTTGGGYRGGDH